MLKYREIRQIAKILASLTHEEPAAEDAARLEEWRACSPANEELYREIVSGDFLKRKAHLAANNDVAQAYAEFVKLAGRTSEANGRSRRRRSAKRRSTIRWAAAIAVLACVGLSVFRPWERWSGSEPIIPGSAKAILTMADGRTFDIEGPEYNDLIAVVASAGDAPPPVNEEGGQEVAVHYNTVTVPRGSEFYLTLNDGTSVWLNAESEIRIPMPFGRSVEVAGEAYFEVVSDPGDPFTVITRHGKVTVTGTSFNVRDYTDEEFAETTLIEGSITFDTEGGRSELTPGDQLRLNKADGEISVAQVDARQYVSWKDGRFTFEQQRLEDIMSTLSRWYDVEVVFESSPIKDILFTGNIKKYDDFDTVMNMLSSVGKVEVEIEGRRIVIKPRTQSNRI